MTHRPSPLSRRALLKGGLGLGALAAFGAPGIRALGAADTITSDQYFIFCYFQGGWDLLLGLDPRDPAIFRNDTKKLTGIQTGFELLPGTASLVRTSVDGMEFGPYIGALADHADKLVVVRGMSMDTLTHEVGRRRFLTGRPPAGLQAQGSSLATILASYLGKDDPVPQLSVMVESYNVGFPTYASAIRVSSVDDLLRALRVNPHALGTDDQAEIDRLLAHVRDCESVRRSDFYRSSLEFRGAAQNLVRLGLDGRFDFAALSPEMEALRDHYGIDPADLRSSPAQGAAAVQAITSGISRCVSIQAAGSLDSHGPEWASAHGPRLQEGFDLMAAIASDLESRPFKDTGDSWLDHTTVVGFSEFGRSPLVNSSGGRDHYLHNAAVLLGGGLRGGRVIGRSSDTGMAPTPLDLATGAPDEGGQIVKPENLFRAILERQGILEDVGDYRADPLTALYT